MIRMNRFFYSHYYHNKESEAPYPNRHTIPEQEMKYGPRIIRSTKWFLTLYSPGNSRKANSVIKLACCYIPRTEYKELLAIIVKKLITPHLHQNNRQRLSLEYSSVLNLSISLTDLASTLCF